MLTHYKVYWKFFETLAEILLMDQVAEAARRNGPCQLPTLGKCGVCLGSLRNCITNSGPQDTSPQLSATASQQPGLLFFFELEVGFTIPHLLSERDWRIISHLRRIAHWLRAESCLVQQLVVWPLRGHLQRWGQRRANEIPPCPHDSLSLSEDRLPILSSLHLDRFPENKILNVLGLPLRSGPEHHFLGTGEDPQTLKQLPFSSTMVKNWPLPCPSYPLPWDIYECRALSLWIFVFVDLSHFFQ